MRWTTILVAALGTTIAGSATTAAAAGTTPLIA